MESVALLREDELQLRRRVPMQLLLLAAPIIASMISRTVMSFVDFVMVSHLGTEAQAAVMPAGVMLFVVISFGMGIMSAVNTFVAQSLGREQLAECSAYTWQGVLLSVVMGVVMLPCWFLVPIFFGWVGHAPEVQRLEIVYTQIGIFGIIPAVAGVALANFFNGIHRPTVGLVAAVVSNLFNFAANYALIFGHWGFPKMGMAGAAWATVAASTMQMVILMAWMLMPGYRRRYHTTATWRPSARRIMGLLRVGLPAAFHFAIDIIGWATFTILLVGRFGTAQLAANNLCFKLLEISFMPTMGLGVAVTAAVGKAIGQRRPDLARLIVRWAVIFAVAYMGMVAMSYVTMRHQMVGLLTNDPAVVEWSERILMLCAIFQIFDALGITYSSALRGAGDTTWPAVVGAIASGTIFLGGGYLIAWLMPAWGSLGPWSVATLYIIVLGILFWARFLRGPWETIDLLGSHDKAAERAAAAV